MKLIPKALHILDAALDRTLLIPQNRYYHEKGRVQRHGDPTDPLRCYRCATACIVIPELSVPKNLQVQTVSDLSKQAHSLPSKQCTHLTLTTEYTWLICRARAILRLTVEACSTRCIDSTSGSRPAAY